MKGVAFCQEGAGEMRDNVSESEKEKYSERNELHRDVDREDIFLRFKERERLRRRRMKSRRYLTSLVGKLRIVLFDLQE